MNKFFERMMQDPEQVDALFLRQSSADTILLMGPTSSAKSTVLTELLPPASNKLLGMNVGDTAQTTLIPPLLMLNSRLTEDQVIIRCIFRKRELYTDFIDQIKSALTEVLYAERDELDDFEISEEFLAKVLDPIDRSYHAFEFAELHQQTELLNDILSAMSQQIIKDPEPLVEAANTRYKQSRIKDKRIKKSDVFEQLIDERFSLNSEGESALKKWYDKLVSLVKEDLLPLWTYPERLMLLGNPSDSAIIDLISRLYSKTSACSLAFDEIQYMTCPSKSVKAEFERLDQRYIDDRTIKFCVRDSIGLSQSSQEREKISDSMDAVLAKDCDAILFFCKSDEQPVVYDMCLELLNEKSKKLGNKPLTICRTKADVRIRNIMVDRWRQEHGTNSIDPAQYDEYIKDAFSAFLKLIELEGKAAPKNAKIEYLSLAADITAQMNQALDNKLQNSRIINILFDLSARNDKTVDGGRPWLQSRTWIEAPMHVEGTFKDLSQTIAIAMVGKNHQQNSQYVQYINQTGIYHGRSVNCFRNKLSYGEGHETRAYVYLDFKLHFKSMVARWLREALPLHDILQDISIDFSNLEESPSAKVVKEEFTEKLKARLYSNWSNVIDQLAFQLTYSCLQKSFEEAFYFKSWNDGFRDALKVIESKFSSTEYWQENIPELVMQLANKQLQSMYIFD